MNSSKFFLSTLIAAAAMTASAYAADKLTEIADMSGLAAGATNTNDLAMDISSGFAGDTVYAFNGNSGLYNIVDSDLLSAVSSGSGFLTIAAWVLPTSTSSDAVFSFGGQSDGVKFALKNGQLQFTTKGVSDVPEKGTVNAGEWTLVAWSLNLSKSGDSRVYVSGNDGTFWTFPVGSWKDLTAKTFGIGTGNSDGIREGFDGAIANLTVFTSADLVKNSDIAEKVGATAPTSIVATWNGGDGTWDKTSASWTVGATQSKFEDGMSAVFAGAGANTITVDSGGVTVLGMSVSSPAEITLRGGVVKVLGVATVEDGATLVLTRNGNGAQSQLQGAVVVESGGTLRFDGQDVTGYSGGATSLQTITIESGATLVLNANNGQNSNETFAGTLNLSGTVKKGENAGIGATWDMWNGNAKIVVADNATASFDGVQVRLGQDNTTIDVGAGATLTLGAGVVERDSWNRTLIKKGAGTLVFGGTSSISHYRGENNVDVDSTVEVASDAKLTLDGNFTLRQEYNGTSTLNVFGKMDVGGKLIVSRDGSGIVYVENGGTLIANEVVFGQAWNGNTKSSVVNVKTGGLFLAGTMSAWTEEVNGSKPNLNNSSLILSGGTLATSADSLDISVSHGGKTLPVVLTQGTTSTIDTRKYVGGDASATETSEITIENVVSGAGALKKTGAGTLTLTGNNTYSGGTTVDGGTLVLTGTNTNGDVTIKSGAILDVSAEDASLFSLTSGSGNTVLVKGTLSVNNSNWGDESAPSSLGRLRYADGVVKLDGGKVIHTTTQETGRGFQVTDNGGIVTAGEGIALTFCGNGNNKYAFTTAGTLTFDVEKTGSITLADHSSDANWVHGVITGEGGIAKTGEGVLTLTKASTYTGGTTIEQGVLVAQHENALGSGSVKVDGGQLKVDGVTLSNTSITVVLGDAYDADLDSAVAAIVGTTGAFSNGTKILLDWATSDADQQALMMVASMTETQYKVLGGSLVGAEGVTFELSKTLKDRGWDGYKYDEKTGFITLVPVPEPSAFGLLAGVGALALVASRRRRNRR